VLGIQQTVAFFCPGRQLLTYREGDMPVNFAVSVEVIRG